MTICSWIVTRSKAMRGDRLGTDPAGEPCAFAGRHSSKCGSCGACGVAQAMAGILMLMPLHRRRGQVYIPADMLAAAGLDRETFLEGDDKQRIGIAIEILQRTRLITSRRRDAPRCPGMSLRPIFPLPCPARSSLLPERREWACLKAKCNCRSFAGNGCWQRRLSSSVSDRSNCTSRRQIGAIFASRPKSHTSRKPRCLRA